MNRRFLLIATLSTCIAITLATASSAAFDIQNGGMEGTYSDGVAPGWTKYTSVGSVTYTQQTSTRFGGSSSQGIKAVNASNYQGGIYQTIDAFTGDAITFAGWIHPIAPTTHAQESVGVQWNGSTTTPTTWEWKFSGSRNSWSSFSVSGNAVSTSGNAASTSVSLFLDVKRLQSYDTTTYWDEIVSYHAYKPLALTVGNATENSLTIDVNTGLNNENALYAITVGGDKYKLETSWLRADGTISNTAEWLTDAQWGNLTLSGLSSLTQYKFQAKARYSSTWTRETALGEIATFTTTQPQAAVPEPASILAACSILAPVGFIFRRRK